MNRRTLLQALMAIPMGLIGARAKQDTPMVAGFRVGVGKIADESDDRETGMINFHGSLLGA